MNTETKTCSGLHEDIVKHSQSGALSPIIAKKLSIPHRAELVSCWLAFPGCDFEVLIENEVSVAFRRGTVLGICDDCIQEIPPQIPPIETILLMSREEFNPALHSNMLLSLRHVAEDGNIVATSTHFVTVIAGAIEALDGLANPEEPVAAEDMTVKLNKLKVELFHHLMSEDLRHG